jgi:hypothetical protein
VLKKLPLDPRSSLELVAVAALQVPLLTTGTSHMKFIFMNDQLHTVAKTLNDSAFIARLMVSWYIGS